MSITAFSERVRQDATHSAYYEAVRNCLLSYKGVKSRASIRCDSYRYKGKLLAKIAVGGHTLKLYLDGCGQKSSGGHRRHDGSQGNRKSVNSFPCIISRNQIGVSP